MRNFRIYSIVVRLRRHSVKLWTHLQPSITRERFKLREFGRSFRSTLHEKDSTEEYLGAFTGIGSSGSAYTGVGSRNKLPLVQLRDIDGILEDCEEPV